MNVRNLKKELNKYKDSDQVYIALKGTEFYFEIDLASKTATERPVLESTEAVNFADIQGMAKECLKENEKYMAPEERELLLDFLIGVEQMERKAV